MDSDLDDQTKLEKLCGWLNQKDCVLETEIFCVSCIKTYPAQSEIFITFNNIDTTLIMDILMGELLTFERYHEIYYY